MSIPLWLVFTLAAWVLVFGGYRLWVAFRRDDDDTTTPHWSKVSVFGRTKRAHAIYGAIYVLAGAMLVATGFGMQMPFAKGCRSMFEKEEAQPAPKSGGTTLDLQPAPANTRPVPDSKTPPDEQK